MEEEEIAIRAFEDELARYAASASGDANAPPLPLSHHDVADIHAAISLLLQETSNDFVQYPLAYNDESGKLELVDEFVPHANMIERARQWQQVATRDVSYETQQGEQLHAVPILQHVTMPLRVSVLALDYLGSGAVGIVHRCIVEDTETQQTWTIVIKEQLVTEDAVSQSEMSEMRTLGYEDVVQGMRCPPSTLEAALNVAPIRTAALWYMEPVAMQAARECMPNEYTKQIIPEIYGTLIVSEQCPWKACRLVSVIMMEEITTAMPLSTSPYGVVAFGETSSPTSNPTKALRMSDYIKNYNYTASYSNVVPYLMVQILTIVQQLRNHLCLRNFDMNMDNVLLTRDMLRGPNEAQQYRVHLLDLSYVSLFLPSRGIWLVEKWSYDELYGSNIERHEYWMNRLDLCILANWFKDIRIPMLQRNDKLQDMMKAYSKMPDRHVMSDLGDEYCIAIFRELVKLMSPAVKDHAVPAFRRQFVT